MTQVYPRLFGVGAGAGDPKWLTLEADRILRDTPVIAFPRGFATETGRAEKIVQAYLKPDKYLLRLALPMTRDSAVLDQAWNDAAEQLLSYLGRGLDVVFVTEGDPSLYSTFSYLANVVAVKSPNTAVEIIPGISSVTAASAMIGTSLVMGQQSLAIIPAQDNLTTLIRALETCDTVVILKISQNFDRIYQLLDSRHLLPSTVYLGEIGTPQQEIVTDLRNFRQDAVPYFSLLVVRQHAVAGEKQRSAERDEKETRDA